MRLQFILFELAFIVTCISNLLIYFGNKNKWDNYVFSLLGVIDHLFGDIGPLGYMIYSHH